MAANRLSRGALDCLQLDCIRLLEFGAIGAIVEELLGHRPAMNAQCELGGLGAEVGGPLHPFLRFTHFARCPC